MTTLKEEIEQEKQEYSKALNPAQNGYRIAVEIIEEKLKYKILELKKIFRDSGSWGLNSKNALREIDRIFGDFEK